MNSSGGLVLYTDSRVTIPLADVRGIALLEFDEHTSGFRELTRATFRPWTLSSRRRDFNSGPYRFSVGNSGREIQIGLQSFTFSLPGLITGFSFLSGLAMLGRLLHRHHVSRRKVI